MTRMKYKITDLIHVLNKLDTLNTGSEQAKYTIALTT